MSSATGASERSRSRILVRTLGVVAAFAAYQLLVHAVVAQGAWSRGVAWVALLPQVAAYAFLFWFFARTLLPGREALITRVARSVHGALPEKIERYTRRVTVFWCAVFASMLVGSITLFVYTRLETWSLVANLLNFPLIAMAFVGEYLWRILRYPGFSHVSLAATLRAFWRHRGASRAH